MVSGETRDYRGRHFCPRCGSWVIGRSGDEIEVNLGSFNLASLSKVGRSAHPTNSIMG